MTAGVFDAVELLLVDDAVLVLMTPRDRQQPFGHNRYDFDLPRYLPCRHPWSLQNGSRVVGRFGAFSSRYADVEADVRGRFGCELIHGEAEHLRCSVLSHWYPLLSDLTPPSVCFAGRPDARRVEAELGWPVFMKGDRQTSRHQRRLSIIDGPAAFAAALDEYARDRVLCWQDVVCRQFVPLRPVEDFDPRRIPASFEFRTFWWRGRLVGVGPYWWQAAPYAATDAELHTAVGLAAEAARRVDVTFLVVDVAQAATGEWLVIEVNDGQESGYAGVPPLPLWRAVVAAERAAAAATARP